MAYSRARLVWLLTAVGTIAGCGSSGDKPPPPCVSVACDAGLRCPRYEPPPSSGDADGDGIPDSSDDDADGDGIPNEIEHAGGHACNGHDVDADGIDNWLDTDSDSDGIPDAEEPGGSVGSDPYAVDTDGDGTSDLLEAAVGTSPTDPDDHPPEGSRAIALPFMSGDVEVTIRIVNETENADVYILLDTTGSMGGERQNLENAIQTVIIPALVDQFEDLAIGIGEFADYPVGSYGCGGACTPPDPPYHHILNVTDPSEDSLRSNVAADVSCPAFLGELTAGSDGDADVPQAVAAIGCHSGDDWPESYTSALHAVATGEGLNWAGGSVPPQRDCPPDHIGYPCFRPEALPIIVLIGDASFHNGPRSEFDYDGTVEAPSWADTIAALQQIGTRVVSVFSGDDMADRTDYEELATLTGAVDDDTPMVFEINSDGTGLDASVVTALGTLAGGIRQDVTTAVSSHPRSPRDATELVVSMRTGEGYGADGLAGAAPGISYVTKDETTFYGMEGGASGDFVFTLRNDTVMPTERAQVLTLVVRGVGTGGATFSTRNVFIIVANGDIAL